MISVKMESHAPSACKAFMNGWVCINVCKKWLAEKSLTMVITDTGKFLNMLL